MSERVPEGWAAKDLGDIAKFSGGGAFKEIYQGISSGTHPFIKVSDMNLLGNERYIKKANNWVSEEIRNEAKIKLFPPDATVFAKVGAALLLNRRRQLVRDTAIDNNMMAAIPFHCDPEFLYYFMQTIDLGNIVQSGAVPSVNQNQMETIPIDTPPLPEQKKIASILTSVDEVIETTQKQIDKLQDLKKATMNELLTKGIGHTEFKDSELGRIPKSWELIKLGQVVDRFYQGINTVADKVEYESTGIPILQTKHITSGEIKFDAIKYLSETTYFKYKDKFQPRRNDILLSNIGTIGKTILVQESSEYLIAWNIFLISVTSQLEPKFAHLYFQKLDAENYYENLMTGNATKFVNKSNLSEILVPLPSIVEQVAISKMLDAIVSKIKLQRQKLSQTQSLKKSLMQDLLTGKVRVQVN